MTMTVSRQLLTIAGHRRPLPCHDIQLQLLRRASRLKLMSGDALPGVEWLSDSLNGDKRCRRAQRAT